MKKDKEKGNKNENEYQKRNDYFCQKLCRFINGRIYKICKKYSTNNNFILNAPIEEITTLNLLYLYIFLNIKYRNFLTINLETKYEFDKLLIELGIVKEKEVNLKKKEVEKALELLKKYKYINKNDKPKKDQIKFKLIHFLKDLKYKKSNEYNLNIDDKIYFNNLLYKEKIKYSHNNQQNNKIKIKELEKNGKIRELDITFRELIIECFDLSNKDKEY